MLRNLIVLPDGTEIFSGNPRGNAIASAEYKQKVNSGTELTIGSVYASCLSVKLITAGGNLSISAGTEFSYYKVADDGTRTKIGLFTMEKPTRSGANSYEIETYDRVSWLDKDLTDWLSSLNGWPYSVEKFARMVCEACGLALAEKAISYSFKIVGGNLILSYSDDQPQYSIGSDGHLMLAYTGDVPNVIINKNGHLIDESGGTPIELPNGDYQIRKFSGSGVTGRMLMQWLGQITCRFIRANADGEIEFAWYSDKGAEITTSGDFAYFGGGLSYEDYQVAEIQKVQIQATDEDNGTVYPDGSEEELNTYKITGNYLLTAETGDELKPVAQTIFEQLQGVTYTPCKVSIQATTEINAGDIVHITDRNGVTITTYVMSKINKGQKDTLECTGSYKRDSSTATNTLTMKALNGKVLDIKKSVDGLRIENRDMNGKFTELKFTVDGIFADVGTLGRDYSALKQTVDTLSAEVGTGTGDLTSLTLRVGSVESKVQAHDGQISTLTHTIDGLTITDSGGTTKINGSSIETENLHVKAANIDGVLKASQIDTANLISGGILSAGSNATVSIENGETSITHVFNGKTFRAGLNAAWFRSYNPYNGKWFASGNGNASGMAMVGWESGANITYTDAQAKLNGTWVGTSSEAVTSDAGKKHNILDLDERYNTLFDLIRPVAYKYNDGTSGRYHTGFVANEVEDALEKAGISTQEFAGFVTIDEENEDGATTKTRCLRYEEFIAVLWGKVKQLEKRLEALA